MEIVSPGCKTFSATLMPLTLTPLVLLRSRMIQHPSLKTSSQCVPDTLGKHKQISHDRRRPNVRRWCVRGMESPLPRTSSPYGSQATAVGVVNHSRLPQHGHGASPAGPEGSTLRALPQTAHRLASPS